MANQARTADVSSDLTMGGVAQEKMAANFAPQNDAERDPEPDEIAVFAPDDPDNPFNWSSVS